MAYSENSADDVFPETVPIPALLAERAIALARAEVSLALVHTRRLAVRAVSAVLGTIVACAFAQLTLLLLVVWPVLAARVSHVNIVFGVLASSVVAAVGAAFAVAAWAGVGRERHAGASAHKSSPKAARSAALTDAAVADAAVSETSPTPPSPTPPSPTGPAGLGIGKRERARTVNLAERVSL
jgi:hypothetical protein